MKTVEEMIAVMQHFANGGKVEQRWNGDSEWFEKENPAWAWTQCDYRIAAPNKKTIKLEAWLSSHNVVRWFPDGHDCFNGNWTRLPQLDITTEVEE